MDTKKEEKKEMIGLIVFSVVVVTMVIGYLWWLSTTQILQPTDAQWNQYQVVLETKRIDLDKIRQEGVSNEKAQ